MDLEDNAMGLTHEQTDKILQFQDLTGIEDMSICRDVLQRHQWDLEVISITMSRYVTRCFRMADSKISLPIIHNKMYKKVLLKLAIECIFIYF